MTKDRKLRAAKFGDIPQVCDMLAEAHRRSRYVDLAPFSEKRAKALLMHAVQRHGGTTEGSTFFAVMDRGEGLEGFIIGVLQPLYSVIEAMEATDLFFYTRPGAHASTARRLMKSMHKWAGKVEGPCIIRQANSDIIVGHERSGPIFERSGMRRVGSIYEKGQAK